METIVFFTAGVTATSAELTAIEQLNTLAEKPYNVKVVNGSENATYGETNRLIPTDFVAGTIPTIYNALPVFDPANPPVPDLPEDQAIISDGDTFTTVDGGALTVAIVDNVPTFTYTAP